MNNLKDKVSFIIESQIIADLEKQKIILASVSQWANAIPYHDLTDFGDKIEVISLIDKPIYKAVFRSHYQERSYNKNRRPHTGGAIPPKFISEGNLNIWSFDTEIPSDFVDKDLKIYPIENSQEVIACPECRGQGEVRCQSCNGTGRIDCPRCDGKGEVPCYSCGGKGENPCGICNGTGQISNSEIDNEQAELENVKFRTVYERCSSCSGRGYIRCTECRNGWVKCNECDGRRQVKCSPCSGTGFVTCPECVGCKELVEYLSLTEKFKVISNELFSKNDILFIEGKVDWQNEIGKPSLSIIDEKISIETFNDVVNNSSLKAKLKTISDSESSRSCRLIKQKLEIFRIECFELDYRYSNKDYSFCIYGPNNKVYDPGSPITETRDNYLTLAKEHFANKTYSDSLDLANKVIAMNSDNQEAKELIKYNLTKIKNQYLFGGIFGGGLSGLLFSLILGIYSYMKANDIYILLAISSLIGGGIGALLGSLYNKLSGIKTREKRKRYLMPFLTSIIVNNVICIAMIYLNMLGTQYREEKKEANNSTTIYCKEQICNIRSGPSMNSNIVKTAKYGEKQEYYTFKDGWYVLKDGQYIHNSIITYKLDKSIR